MERIRQSFERQGFMGTLGAALESVEPGTVTITCAFETMMPAEKEVLTVEFKINFLKPAKTDAVVAVGQVVQSGRTLTVCEGTVFDATRARVLAKMTATMMAVDASG